MGSLSRDAAPGPVSRPIAFLKKELPCYWLSNCTIGGHVFPAMRSFAANSLASLRLPSRGPDMSNDGAVARGTRLSAGEHNLLFLFATTLLALTLGCTHSDAAAGIRQESIRFNSDGCVLAGSLWLPGGSGRHPAIVLFHGSGPEERYDDVARWFAGEGVAALTYDKRGVGESTCDFRAIPFMTLADDGIAAVQLLKARGDIDAKRIGVWGLSQGGWLGPLAASRSSDIAFVIAVSGPGVSPGEQMIFYYSRELQNQGLAQSDVEAVSKVRREVWTYMETGQGYEQARADLDSARKATWYEAARAQQDELFNTLVTPAEWAGSPKRWFKQEAIYDPKPALRNLHVPALFIFGGADDLVPVPESIKIIRSTLESSGARDFTIRELPQTRHGMRIANSKGELVVNPEYLRTMSEWLKAHGD